MYLNVYVSSVESKVYKGKNEIHLIDLFYIVMEVCSNILKRFSISSLP